MNKEEFMKIATKVVRQDMKEGLKNNAKLKDRQGLPIDGEKLFNLPPESVIKAMINKKKVK